eukprot:gene27904-33699_t
MSENFTSQGLRRITREDSSMSLASSKSADDNRLVSSLSSLNFDAPPEPPTVELRVDSKSRSITRVPSRNTIDTITHSHPTPFPYIPSPKSPLPKSPQSLFATLDDTTLAIPSTETFMAFSPSDTKMVSPTRILRKNLRTKFLRETSNNSLSAMNSSDGYDVSILPPVDFGEGKCSNDEGKDAKDEFRTRRYPADSDVQEPQFDVPIPHERLEDWAFVLFVSFTLLGSKMSNIVFLSTFQCHQGFV